MSSVRLVSTPFAVWLSDLGVETEGNLPEGGYEVNFLRTVPGSTVEHHSIVAVVRICQSGPYPVWTIQCRIRSFFNVQHL